METDAGPLGNADTYEKLLLAKEAHLFLKQASVSSKTQGRLFTPLQTTVKEKKNNKHRRMTQDEFHIENLSVTEPVTVPSKPGTLVGKGIQSLRKTAGLGTSV